MTAVRTRPRLDKTRAWTAAKILILSGFVALGIAVHVAWQPVTNPHVQECGTSISFFVQNRSNVVIHPGEPGAPVNAVALASQPTCQDLAWVEIQKAGVAVLAFIGLTLLGIIVGLVDDRIGYWSAPRYETLLRDMPRAARIEHGLIPNIDVDELGAQLPPIETTEIWALVLFGIGTFVALPFAGPLDATRAAAAAVLVVPVLTAIIGVVVSFVAAALQRTGVYAADESAATTTEVVVAAAWAGRLRALVGSFGIDIHHLRKAGIPRSEVVLDVQVLQTVSLVVHVVLLALTALAVRGLAWPAWHLERPQYVLAGVLGLLLLSGLNRAGRRWRALPVRPGLAGLRGLRRVASTPRQALELFGGTLLLTAANVAALLLVLDAFGVALPVTQVLLAYLVAVALGALSPTPGGVGVVESALVLLLVVAGVDPGAAVCATLAFRLLTFWLPMLAGWRATRSLRQAGAL
jgi:hypothetical protein